MLVRLKDGTVQCTECRELSLIECDATEAWCYSCHTVCRCCGESLCKQGNDEYLPLDYMKTRLDDIRDAFGVPDPIEE